MCENMKKRIGWIGRTAIWKFFYRNEVNENKYELRDGMEWDQMTTMHRMNDGESTRVRNEIGGTRKKKNNFTAKMLNASAKSRYKRCAFISSFLNSCWCRRASRPRISYEIVVSLLAIFRSLIIENVRECVCRIVHLSHWECDRMLRSQILTGWRMLGAIENCARAIFNESLCSRTISVAAWKMSADLFRKFVENLFLLVVVFI